MPSGQNLWNEKLSNRRLRGKGSVEALQKQLWLWIKIAGDGIEAAVAEGDVDLALRWIHAGNQLSATYLKAVLPGDLEQRIKAIEAAKNDDR